MKLTSIAILVLCVLLPLRGEADQTDRFKSQLEEFRVRMAAVAAKPSIISNRDWDELESGWKVVCDAQKALPPLEQRRVNYRFRCTADLMVVFLFAKQEREQGDLTGAQMRMQIAHSELGEPPSVRAVAFRPTPKPDPQPKRVARAQEADPLPVTGCEQFVVPFAQAVSDLKQGLVLLDQARSMAGKAYAQFEMGRIARPSGTVSAELRNEIEKLLASADSKLKRCPAPAADCKNCRPLRGQLASAIKDAREAAADLFRAKSLDQIQQTDRSLKQVRQQATHVENRMPLD